MLLLMLLLTHGCSFRVGASVPVGLARTSVQEEEEEDQLQIQRTMRHVLQSQSLSLRVFTLTRAGLGRRLEVSYVHTGHGRLVEVSLLVSGVMTAAGRADGLPQAGRRDLRLVREERSLGVEDVVGRVVEEVLQLARVHPAVSLQQIRKVRRC